MHKLKKVTCFLSLLYCTKPAKLNLKFHLKMQEREEIEVTYVCNIHAPYSWDQAIIGCWAPKVCDNRFRNCRLESHNIEKSFLQNLSTFILAFKKTWMSPMIILISQEPYLSLLLEGLKKLVWHLLIQVMVIITLEVFCV